MKTKIQVLLSVLQAILLLILISMLLVIGCSMIFKAMTQDIKAGEQESNTACEII